MVPEASWWDLTPTPLVFGEQGGVFLQYPEAAPPVMEVKFVPQDVPGTRGPRASGKGAWALRCALRKNYGKDLRNLFCLTDRQLVPVYFQLRSVHATMVCRH